MAMTAGGGVVNISVHSPGAGIDRGQLRGSGDTPLHIDRIYVRLTIIF